MHSKKIVMYNPPTCTQRYVHANTLKYLAIHTYIHTLIQIVIQTCTCIYTHRHTHVGVQTHTRYVCPAYYRRDLSFLPQLDPSTSVLRAKEGGLSKEP